MSDHVIFVGWGEAIPGREMKALDVFTEVVAYYTGLKERGEIEGFEAFALAPHGGDLSGFLLVRGDAQKLGQIRASDEFMRLNARARFVVQNFGVVNAVTGNELNRLFQMLAQQVEELS
jgi:hypothetical protein